MMKLYSLGRAFKLHSIVQRILIYCLWRTERKFPTRTQSCTHSCTHAHPHGHSLTCIQHVIIYSLMNKYRPCSHTCCNTLCCSSCICMLYQCNALNKWVHIFVRYITSLFSKQHKAVTKWCNNAKMGVTRSTGTSVMHLGTPLYL